MSTTSGFGELMLVRDSIQVSTADDEKNYFTGPTYSMAPLTLDPLGPGTYRVIDGELYRIVGLQPPGSIARE
jgi:hypothetical protein